MAKTKNHKQFSLQTTAPQLDEAAVISIVQDQLQRYRSDIRLGGGSNVMGLKPKEGLHLGNGKFGDSPFRVNMDGDLVASSATINGLSLTNEHLFGDGSDGDLTTSGDVSLSKDTFYDDLTVSGGDTLTLNGWHLFVRGTLTVAGTVEANGNDGGNGGNASGANQTTGGTAGTAGAALNSNTVYGSLIGEPGGAGGSFNQNGNPGDAGQNQSQSLNTNNGTSGGTGGQGYTGYAGGAGGGGGTPTDANRFYPNTVTYFHDMQEAGSSELLKSGASSGGGGGGGAGVNGSGTGGGGGGGGGSGSPGGLAVICAKTMTVSGTISANGGDGGNGGIGGTGGGAGSGGGGGGAGGAGGNGGVVAILYGTLTNTGTIGASGGTGGTGGAGGVGLGGTGQVGGNGTDGATGRVIQLQI